MDRIPSPTHPEARESVRTDTRESTIPPGLADDGRQRLRSGSALVDPYNLDDIRKAFAPTNGDPKKGNIDNEIDFEWKAYETYGKPKHTELRGHREQGWKAVMYGDFPDRFAPIGTEGPVRVNDMILMHRPMRLTVQARKEDYLNATRQMQVHRQKMAETPEGQHPRVVLADKSSREAIEIPE